VILVILYMNLTYVFYIFFFFFFSSRRRHTRSKRDWSSDVCSSDLLPVLNQKIQTTNASYTQRLYFFKKKKNILTFDVKLPRDISINSIYQALNNVTMLNPVLRSSLQQNGKELQFNIYKTIKFDSSLVFNMAKEHEILNKMLEMGFKSRYQNGPLINMSIFQNKKSRKAIFIVDHCIFDA